MTLLDPPTTLKEFKPGTTGWAATDLDDPRIERLWFAGRYEIIEGVLTEMAPAYFSGGDGLQRLLYRLQEFLLKREPFGGISTEVDIIIDEQRVVVSDAVYMDVASRERQKAAAIADGRRDLKRTRILVPPTVVIENISPGHETHDRNTKRRWYAEFGVPHYWLLDVFEKSLECLVLNGGTYQVDAAAEDDRGILKPAAFPGLSLRLEEICPQ
jgi:Uma2 family endonuclease